MKLFNWIWKIRYKKWLKIREESEDEYTEKLCYCGHTYKCICGDPGLELFKDSVKRKTIKLNDKENGWR